MSQEQKEQYQPPKDDDQEDGDEESKEESQLTSVYAINPSINYDESQSLNLDITNKYIKADEWVGQLDTTH